MKKRYGPLPLWAWGLSGIVMIYLYYRYSQSSSSSSSSTTASSTGIDPITGVPYSQEEAAYQSEAASAQSPAISGGGSSSGGTDLGQEITDITGLIQALEGSGLIPTPGSGSTTPSDPVTKGNSDGTTTPGTGGSPSAPPATNGRVSTGTLLNPKAILAPFGSTAPPPRAGYTAVGTGNGNWQYVPDSLVNVAGGYLFGSISHNAPNAPNGSIARGLGNGLWEIVPRPRTTTGSRH